MDGIAQRAGDRVGESGIAAPRVVISLLGGFRVTVDGHDLPPDAWKRRKARSIVKLLALAPRQTLHREEVLDQLWPDLDPDAANSNLRLLLHFARSAFRSVGDGSLDVIQLRDDHLSLRLVGPGAIDIDVDRFRSAATAAQRSGDAVTLQAAIDLYAGDLLPEDRYDDWAAAPRETLRETYLSLLLALADLLESQGAYDAALATLDRVVNADEMHEDAHAGMIRIYARMGRTGQALRQYARFREVLHRELDIEPSAATQRLHADVAAGRFPSDVPTPDQHGDQPAASVASPVQPGHNLPESLTSLVGRQRELEEVAGIFKTTRLLSLIGTGGAGKSRLALELARGLINEYEDGVWLVELASQSDPTVVPNAVAATIGLREQPGTPVTDTLVEALRSQSMVLVLDNCEHLIDACATLVETLLAGCPRLSVITTSREALRVPGEVVWQVPPMALPPAPRGSSTWTEASLKQLAQVAAVELFVSRARWVRPDFILTPEDADAVVQICHRLDGLPLALELAAARTSVLPPVQLAARLDDALGVLSAGSRTAPARHKTLQATLDWSYALLDARERTLLRRLSVFAGGWTLDAAESVCAGPATPATDDPDDAATIEPSDVLTLMAQLIDKSLVQVGDRSTQAVDPAEVRYRLLQTVHQYAAARLASSADAEQIGEQHAAYFLSYAEMTHPKMSGPEQALWLHRVDRDYDNLRAALRWFNSRGDVASEARLCFVLMRFWYFHSHLVEGSRILDDLIGRIDDPAVPPLVRARILNGAGVLAWNHGDMQRAVHLSSRALAIFEEIGDLRGISDSTQSLGIVAEIQGKYAEATSHYQAALRVREEMGDDAAVATILHNLGNMAREQGEPVRAADLYERSLAMQRSRGNTRGIALALASLAVVALDQSEYELAANLSEQSLELYQQIGAKSLRVTATNNLGYALQFLGDLERAVAVQSACLRLAVEVSDKRGIAYGLEGIASAFGAYTTNPRSAEQAARAFGAADGLRDAIQAPLPVTDLALNAPSMDSARTVLGDEAYQAAWRAGRTLPLNEVVAGVLAVAESLVSATPSTPDITHAQILSPREREVAILVASGMTNRQIAEQLGMAGRTVDTHVRNLLRKLTLSSRTDVAAWAAKHGLTPPS